MLFAYPNRENVRGTNLILDMIDDRKKCTVVFSRIDVTNEGRNKAKQFFYEINTEQEFIGIEYDSAIAVTSIYPVENKLDKYTCISEVILDDEVNNFNTRWISENTEKVNRILGNLETGKCFNKILTNDERKFNDKSNYIIVKDNNTKLKDIVDGYGDKEKLFAFNFYNINFKYDLTHASKISAAIVNMLAIAAVNCNSHIDSEKEINTELEFQNCFDNLNVENKDGKKWIKDTVDVFNSMLKVIEKKVASKKIYLIININDIMDDKFKEIPNDFKFELILIIISALNMNGKFQFKLVFNTEQYEKYKNDLKEAKANTLNLSWSNQKPDILIDNIRQIFNETSKSAEGISDNDKILNNAVKNEDFISRRYTSDILSSTFVVSDLIYCKRVDSTKYSKEFILWFR